MSTNTIDQLILFKRLLIIFGSVCCLWLIIGFIFLSIETYRQLKEKTNYDMFRYNRILNLPSLLLTNIKQTLIGGNMSENDDNDDDDDDDRISIVTSVSFISERSKTTHEHPYFTSSCQHITDEPMTITFPSSTGFTNLAYSPSILSSSSDNATSLLYHPAYQNFSYPQSNDNYHKKSSIPSLNSPPSTSRFNFKRQLSTNTLMSEMTNATYMSSKSAIKTLLLPTLMITDVDRLQTDIIELENFEPEKEWYHKKSQLRFLLNDHMPYEIK
ncbi:unnamed protein product [Adineta steineri]|uniref:Uncharacterized protein n=1 Tax=Adineta steineri TaxID=433720 RepID=A0A814CRQ3_9BILA|nr:unnamed protein product [Adineta steineri]CAF1181156.1 unnamed protein product [Adineta steineri]